MTTPAVSLAPISTAAPVATDPLSSPLHHHTPLIHSAHLSARTGHNVYLKLDSDQPSGSFKIRGIGAICQSAIAQYGAGQAHLVSSSGGNAGLAVAYAASTIYVPVSTEDEVVARLRAEGARVVVGGEAWDQADAGARADVERMRERGEGAVYVHPFEGDALVAGHSGLVDEIVSQLPHPDVLVCSVGGGGLLRGIIHGVRRHPTQPVLVAVQNFGVDSFNRSLDSYTLSLTPDLPTNVVQLTAIQSKCTSMGTKKCSLATLHDAIAFSRSHGEIHTLTITDNLSASACWQFSDISQKDLGKERMVELSCASALTPLFHPWILQRIVEGSERLRGKGRLNVVVEVCGGSKVSAEMLEGYREAVGLMERGDRVRVNGVDYDASS
ncbi:related to CHA1-L-serine/L-threonine deaminase [Sporisorium reilianum f. sp. reilianum]|uniref:L-serine ammonia-lyase n=1 Tax=Sporisorium reilianum f. sp. reilianum TaxID=72559 RepID=A0A2N8UAK4_9BASI|nr:related to CHA1-L-serine/L-threonine deaminase [Sporisorium reilianum f. sp. reilianum]